MLFAWMLQKPMTVKELVEAMSGYGMTVHKGKVRLLLRKFEKRNLAFCITPKEGNGRLYFLTELGRNAVRQAFNTTVDSLPERINWKRYAFVERGQVRKLTLIEIGNPFDTFPKTAGRIRKRLTTKHPVGMAAVIRAVRELLDQNLIKGIGATEKKSRPIYGLTRSGKRIYMQLVKPIQPMPACLFSVWHLSFNNVSS